MRILFITHVTTMAGANRSMFQLIKELKEIYGVYIVVGGPKCSYNNTIKGKLREIGVEYIDAPVRFFKVPNPSFGDFINYLRYLHGVRVFCKNHLPLNIDIVHSNSSVIDCGAYLSKFLKCKHVWHLREFGDMDYSLLPLGGKLYERFTYCHADAYIAISKAVESHFARKVRKEKIHQIYNGIEKVDKRLVSKHDRERVEFLCSGVICSAKNQKEVVLAVNELVNNLHEDKFHVTFVGIQFKDYVHEINNLIKHYRIESYITLLPEVDGIQELASKMDVGIIPSRAEAFGRVTIEYMLQNLLVIANDQGANMELIDDGITGYIYKAGNYEDLADRMKKAIDDPHCLSVISEAGMKKANDFFLSIYNTESIYELYQKLLSE